MSGSLPDGSLPDSEICVSHLQMDQAKKICHCVCLLLLLLLCFTDTTLLNNVYLLLRFSS